MKNKYHGGVFIMKRASERAEGKKKKSTISHDSAGRICKSNNSIAVFTPCGCGRFSCIFNFFFLHNRLHLMRFVFFLLALPFEKKNQKSENINGQTKREKKILNSFTCARLHLIFSLQKKKKSCATRHGAERRAAHKLTKHRSHSDVTFVQRRLARL